MNTIQNEATISYVSSGKTNTVTTPEVDTIIVDPNLRVIKSCCVKNAQRGDKIRYTVSVINSGDIATAGNVVIKDYLDKAGTHVTNSTDAWRNNQPLTIAPNLDNLNRSNYFFEYDTENIPSVIITSLLPGDVMIFTYTVFIDLGTTLINNELHNTATATYELNSNSITQRSDICTVNINYSLLVANKRGRAQGHDLSNLFYALELTNDGTSAASDIVITETFPNSFQPNSGYEGVEKDIAIVNFMRYANTIENIIRKANAHKNTATSFYERLNSNYYRLKALLQDALAKIAQLSSLSVIDQQTLIYNTTQSLIPDLQASQTLSSNAYARLFLPTTGAEPGFRSAYEAIETLFNATVEAMDTAALTTLPDNKDKRASLVCDAHDGGIALLDLCDETNHTVIMAFVVNRYISTISRYMKLEFEILAMSTIPLYQPTYKTISGILTTSETNQTLCSQQKNLVVKKTTESEALMVGIMDLAFSETEKIKEDAGNYIITIDQPKNILTLTLRGIQIAPQQPYGTVRISGHMDIYLNGHIEMDKF